MKKINLTLLVLIIGLSGFAQYKKASYFNKVGRIYGLGTHFYALGSDMGTRMGYTFSVLIDRDGKQWFSGWSAQYLPGYKTPIGTTTGSFAGSINFGYFLLKNESTERKIKPYLGAAIATNLIGGIKGASVYDDKGSSQVGVSIGGGAGLFYYLKPWLGLQAEGGYTYPFIKENTYNLFPKHPYASVGLCFRILNK